MTTRLIEKCWKDPDFKKEVVADPKGLFEKYTGQKLPENVKIFIHEEDANTLHFSIPPAPTNSAELTDEELDKVAGGRMLRGRFRRLSASHRHAGHTIDNVPKPNVFGRQIVTPNPPFENWLPVECCQICADLAASR